MRRLAALASTILAWSLAASPAAAQATTAPWGGFYVGGSAGGAWSRSAFETTTSCGDIVFYFRCINIAAVQNGWSGGRSTTSALASLHAGYAIQSGAFVAGVEADIGLWSMRNRLNGGGQYVAPIAGRPFTTSASTSANWLATLRGRAGWSFGDILIYATGGLALSEIKVRNAFTDPFPTRRTGLGDGSGAATRLGWALGGGGEWRFAPGWSVRAEYLYVDFGSKSARGQVVDIVFPADFNSPTKTSARVNAHIARIGLSRQF